jgi:excinuclease UvrABC nuclease subunit
MSQISLTWSTLIALTDNNIETINNVAGVYRFSKKADDNQYYVFFVGSSDNIGATLKNHTLPSETNEKLRNFLNQGGDIVFRYAIVEEKNIQLAIEKQMYKYYLPECNLEEPQSTLEVEANLN